MHCMYTEADKSLGNTQQLKKHLSMKVIHIICKMCTRNLPDMYALSHEASDIHIREILHAHVITITYIGNNISAENLVGHKEINLMFTSY